MASVQSWADLPDNILVRISAFLPCRADRVHMACVNRHWYAAVTGLRRPPPPLLPPLPPLPPQLPWLIFPSTEPPTFYSVLGDSYHRIYRLPLDARAARFCGSGDGGWLVLAFQHPPHGHALYNLNSGERVPLPPGFRSPSSDNAAELPLVVQAATLSASPSNDGGPYVVAAIALVDGNRPTAAFCSPGRESWFTTGYPLSVMPQDVIYHGGAFFFIMPDEELVMFRTERHGPTNGNVTLGPGVPLDMRRRIDYLADIGMMLGVGRMRLYLVESWGGLHMVVRYIFDGKLGTKMFQVSRFGDRTWEQIDNLDGRMLFLGQGCSRSFEVARYDGFRESDIYFLDESFFAVLAVDGEANDDADAGLDDDDNNAGLEDAGAGSGDTDDGAGSVDDGAGAGAGSEDDGDDAISYDDDGDDGEAGSVDDRKPDMGRFSLTTGRPEPWPPGRRPRTDVPPIWWLH